jgi:hypothetical protein
MDFAQARKDIEQWSQEFVERPHPALAGWPPCPHARRARTEGRLDIRPGVADPYTDLRSIELGRFEVIAFVYDPQEFSASEFEQQIQAVNAAFLVPRDLVALADHPGSPEIVKGVTMNQGQWAIAFVQSLGQLNAVAKGLADRGYYQDWSEDYLQQLFEHRKDPRQ